jgi:hypothetical protein
MFRVDGNSDRGKDELCLYPVHLPLAKGLWGPGTRQAGFWFKIVDREERSLRAAEGVANSDGCKAKDDMRDEIE